MAAGPASAPAETPAGAFRLCVTLAVRAGWFRLGAANAERPVNG